MSRGSHHVCSAKSVTETSAITVTTTAKSLPIAQ